MPLIGECVCFLLEIKAGKFLLSFIYLPEDVLSDT